MRGSFEVLWDIMGDFNEILVDSEKVRGRLRASRLMSNFRDAVMDCNLAEVSSSGPLFT